MVTYEKKLKYYNDQLRQILVWYGYKGDIDEMIEAADGTFLELIDNGIHFTKWRKILREITEEDKRMNPDLYMHGDGYSESNAG